MSEFWCPVTYSTNTSSNYCTSCTIGFCVSSACPIDPYESIISSSCSSIYCGSPNPSCCTWFCFVLGFLVSPCVSTSISFVAGTYYSSTRVGITGSMTGEGMASMSTTPSECISFVSSAAFSYGDIMALHLFLVVVLGALTFDGTILLNPMIVSLNPH
jgi:hypothetical protein